MSAIRPALGSAGPIPSVINARCGSGLLESNFAVCPARATLIDWLQRSASSLTPPTQLNSSVLGSNVSAELLIDPEAPDRMPPEIATEPFNPPASNTVP